MEDAFRKACAHSGNEASSKKSTSRRSHEKSDMQKTSSNPRKDTVTGYDLANIDQCSKQDFQQSSELKTSFPNSELEYMFTDENATMDKNKEDYRSPLNQKLNFKITTLGSERKVEVTPRILKDTPRQASGWSEETPSVFDSSSDSANSHSRKDSSGEDSSDNIRNPSEKFHSEKHMKKRSYHISKLSHDSKASPKSSPSIDMESLSFVVNKKKSSDDSTLKQTTFEEMKPKGGFGRGIVKKLLRDSCNTTLDRREDSNNEVSSKNSFESSSGDTVEGCTRISSNLGNHGFGRGLVKKLLHDNVDKTKTGYTSDLYNQQTCESLFEAPDQNISPLLDNQFSDPPFEETQSRRGIGRGLSKKLLSDNTYSSFNQVIKKNLEPASEVRCEHKHLENERSSPDKQKPELSTTISQRTSLPNSVEEFKVKFGLGRGLKINANSNLQRLDQPPQKSAEEIQFISQPQIEHTTFYPPGNEDSDSYENKNVLKESVALSPSGCKERSDLCSVPHSSAKEDNDVGNYTQLKIKSDNENLNFSKEVKQTCDNKTDEMNSVQIMQVNNGPLNNITANDGEGTTSFSPHLYKSKPPSTIGTGILGRLFFNVMHKENEEITSKSEDKDESAAPSVCELETDLESKNSTPLILTSKKLPDKMSNLQEHLVQDKEIIFQPNGEELENQESKGIDLEKLLNTSVISNNSSGPSEAVPVISTVGDGATSASDLTRDSDEENLDSYRIGSTNSYREDMLSKIHSTGSIIHGDIHISLVSKIYDLNFHNLIIKNLQYRKIIDLARSQMLLFPIVANERNLLLIGPPRTKKTSGWLIPILNSLLNDKQHEPLNSPKCIILAPGSHRVRHIARLCSAYVGAKLITIATYGGGLELERKDELLSGVDILISTPRCCLRLFQCKHIIKPDRLRYFVLDSVEDMLNIFPQEITLFKNGLDNLTKMRETFGDENKLQIIMAGTIWTKQIEDISLNWMKNPVICITSYLEAAIYSRVNFKLNITKSEAKIATLYEMISNKNSVRTVVVCCNVDEAKLLRTKLCTLVRRTVMVAHEEIHHTLIPEIRRTWPLVEHAPILVCTDGILQEMDMSNAEWLIHYNLPNNKSDFRERFRFIKDSFVDRVKNVINERPKCAVDIFIDENTERFLPKILEMLDRLNLPVSEELKIKAQEIEKIKEMEKSNIMFCENILQFGHCWKSNCKMRHLIISTKDASQLETPIKNFVTLNILDVISPTHLIGRITSYSQKLFTEETHLNSKFLQITLKLAEFFMDNENRCTHGRPVVGDIVAVHRDEVFARGKIVEILERDNKCAANKVSLYLLDWGAYITEEVDKILSLPLDLQVLPGDAINIYITGLLPLDLDRCWSYTSTKCIKEKVMGYQNDKYRDVTIIGQVEMIVGRDLLLDKLLFYEEPPEGCPPWLIDSLRQFIISSNFGIYNHKHKDVLKKLAKEIGITLAEEVEKKEEAAKSQPNNTEAYRWAFLTKDSDHLVNVTVAEDIHVFFVRLTKFQSCLDLLEKDLKAALMKEMTLLDEFNVGTVCAVEDPLREKFIRGMIIEPLELIDQHTEVEVWFVDYGERLVFQKSEICKLPQDFVGRLPFQAIECGLAGIKSCEKGESEEALDTLEDLTTSGDCLSSLYLRVVEVNKHAEMTGGCHYDVVLIDTNGEQDIIINEQMVKRGHTDWEDNMKEVVMNIGKQQQLSRKSEDETSYSDDELQENWDSSNKAVTIMPPNNEESHFITVDGELKDFDQFEFVADFEAEFLKPLLLKNIMPSAAIEMTKPEQKEQIEWNSVNENDELIQTNDNLCDNDECCFKRATIYSPTVHWRQSTNYLWIKILLPDVKVFKMEWTMTYINFQTIQEDRLYFVDIDLFGPINPDTVMHKITGLYFEIRLSKLLTEKFEHRKQRRKGNKKRDIPSTINEFMTNLEKRHYWPRLFYTNQKARGIIHDPDKVALHEDEYEKEDKSLIPSYVARSETSEQIRTVSTKGIISKFRTKFDHNALEEDGSASSGESDIDEFSPIPDTIDNFFED